MTRHAKSRTRTPVANGSIVVRILRRNCLPKHVIDGKVEGTRRRRRRRKQPLGDNKREDTVNRKKKDFDHTLWKTRIAGGCGHTTRETTCLVQRPLSVRTRTWVSGTSPRTRTLFIVQKETFFGGGGKRKVPVVSKVDIEVRSCF